MKKVSNQQKLLQQLCADVKQSELEAVSILAGHFPLRVDTRSKRLYEDVSVWGDFSTYTLELGTYIAEYAQSIGKKVGFVFLCDDQTYRDGDKTLLVNGDELSEAQLDNRWRSARDTLYKERSGVTAQLPQQYRSILGAKGFSEEHVLRHDHEKASRGDCLYFSEAVLRSPRQLPTDQSWENVAACSREYIALLKSKQLAVDSKESYLVSFIPSKCSHYVCDAVDFFVTEFKGSHIFMDTMDVPTSKVMYERGVYYKRGSN